MAQRFCSECPNPVTGDKITCSGRCRSKRARRLAKMNRDSGEASTALLTYEAQNNVRNELPKVTREELRPVVRSAITEEVMAAIQDFVGLTPQMVAALQDDLNSDDPTIRQRAYTVGMKYTVGHPALTDKDSQERGNQINVTFALPRPDDIEKPAGFGEEATDAEVVEPQRECDMCHETKEASEFVTGSNRCQSCFDSWRETIANQYSATIKS